MLCHLTDRSLLRLQGEELRGFLQGIITNNITLLETQPALFAALLSPQGKLLHDFFLTHDPDATDALLLEAHSDHMQALVALLTTYRLRAKITFTPLPDWQVYAEIGNDASLQGDVMFQDPRHPEMGARIYARTALSVDSHNTDAYEKHRLHIGIPEAAKDAVAGRSFPLELGYDRLHAVDFSKGCYVGQEVTARSRFRGTLRKGLYHAYAEVPLPPAGTEIMQTDGIAIGEMRSSYEGVGLAMLRHEAYMQATEKGDALHADGIPVRITPLMWNGT
jgi:tRNA-modifying protein YgfZ